MEFLYFYLCLIRNRLIVWFSFKTRCQAFHISLLWMQWNSEEKINFMTTISGFFNRYLIVFRLLRKKKQIQYSYVQCHCLLWMCLNTFINLSFSMVLHAGCSMHPSFVTWYCVPVSKCMVQYHAKEARYCTTSFLFWWLWRWCLPYLPAGIDDYCTFNFNNNFWNLLGWSPENYRNFYWTGSQGLLNSRMKSSEDGM